jgi:ABC-2 type transport system ATP-binding protein
MPEERGLYPKMRVRDHLIYLARLHGLTAQQAGAATSQRLQQLGLGARACDRVETLSHGTKQRVQLAAALVHRPRMLVLDEPFAGLDPVGIEQMARVLRELARAGATIVFSSHQLDLVEGICDEVAIIDRGRVVLEGAVRELKKAGSPRLIVELEGVPSEWYGGMPVLTVESIEPNRVRVTLDAADPGMVLDRAGRSGEIRRFAIEEPSLLELFLQAVGP